MRNLTADFITQLKAKKKSVAIFYEAEFASGYVYLWTGQGSIDWNGQTWTGVGHVVAISQVSEDSNVRADGIICTLSGISEEIRSIVLSEVQQGKPGIVYAGFIDTDGTVVADPASAFEGRLDVPKMVDGGPAISVSFAYETRLRDLERAREQRYTNQSQQVLFAGDKGFEYVPSLQDWAGTWGRA